MKALLDNIAWHSLSGLQARYATGAGGARRYAPGFSPIVGFEDPANPDFAALTPYCRADEHFYCDGWSGVAPADWRVDEESTMFKMVWAGAPPGAARGIAPVRLGPEHAAAALALAQLTRPGPFGPRTPELGEYWGCFEGGRLVAMAGERMQAAGLREISGVCTHPDFQGRGLARALMQVLIGRQIARGQLPFLHVMHANPHAHRLYAGMGFRDAQESVVRVVSLR